MGSLAPVLSWIPEDDLLLKNAVEAGASLESLAKGAVRFSQRFTVRELQDRWLALLYDPVVSAEASAHMIELERSSLAHPSKSNRVGVPKENKCTEGKRKLETVRSYYYALRKRICSEPFDSMDLSFLVGPPNGTYVGNGDQPLSGNCIPGHPISTHFGVEVSGMDTIVDAFPESLMDAGAAFTTGLQNPTQAKFQMEQNNIPHILGEDLPPINHLSAFGQMGEPKDFSEHCLFTGNQVNSDQPKGLEFEANKVFNTPVSGSVAPFNSMEYSPLPGMSIWKTEPEPALPVELDIGNKDLCSGDGFNLPDDYDAVNTIASGYGVHSSPVKVKVETDYDGFQVHNSPVGYLAELSNSLLNFTNEEELLVMNADGKDMIDKSYYDGLSSLLLNSPNGGSQEQENDFTEPKQVSDGTQLDPSAAPDACTDNTLSLCHEDDKALNVCSEQMTCDTQIEIPSTISASLEFPELKDGVICCVLNTEEFDIPCNDDVFLQNPPGSVSSEAEQRLQAANKPSPLSAKASFIDQRIRDRGPSQMHKEQIVTGGESNVYSSRLGSHSVQVMGPNPAGGNFGIKSAVSKPDLAVVASRVSGVPTGCLDMINSTNASTDCLLPETQKDRPTEVLTTKHLNSTDCPANKPPLVSANFTNYPHTDSAAIKEEHNVSAAIRDQDVHAELMPMNMAVSGTVLDDLAGDDESPLDSDVEIPYYSDIEAMILDMDLDPNDQDLNVNEEVLRYQQEDTRRTIIRLEQSAHAHIQRTIASHGALAILYGRHSKHYIKKPEVLLGRATAENIVDVDLGREGRSNKISRKQAIIKMDKDGSFHLKNLNSASIFVNSKEVGYKQSINLTSSCLIEIRGLAFIFEWNQTRVKMYLESIKDNDTPETQEPKL